MNIVLIGNDEERTMCTLVHHFTVEMWLIKERQEIDHQCVIQHSVSWYAVCEYICLYSPHMCFTENEVE